MFLVLPMILSLGIDYVGYALGQTDTFQGTGVFSGIKMQRESSLPPTTAETAASPTEGSNDALPPVSQVTAEAVGTSSSSSAETANAKEPASTV
jgi:hypothetical protein